jgi:hypothetical protein
LDRIQEIWSWCWTPEVESSLIERMPYGATIAEAAGALLLERIRMLEQRGAGRNARAAVSLLTAALRMGLFDHVERLSALILETTADDPSFGSVVAALSELVLLSSSREPLEAFRLPRLAELSTAAYQRATYLIDELSHVGAEAEKDALAGLSTLRGLLSPTRDLDPALLHEALERVIEGENGAIAGGAAGLLFSDAKLAEERLLSLLAGHLGGGKSRTAFLRGVLMTAREVAWRLPGFVRAVTELLSSWDEEDFLGALPELRLAFADLTPKETDRVAALVGREQGKELGELFVFDVSEEEVQANLRISERARGILARDRLAEWA